MKRSFPLLILLVVSLTVLVHIPALAQRPGGMKRHGERHARNLENVRMFKLLELLELTDEQSPPFIARFVDFRKDFRTVNEKIEKEVQSLTDLINSPEVRDQALLEKIETIEKLQEERIEVVRIFHDDAAGILTAEQLAKMIVFEERFERELLETIRGFHDRPAPREGR